MAATPSAQDPPGTLADRLNRLFQAAGEPSNREVARAVQQAGGPPISHVYIGELRNGTKTNPTIRHLQALAVHFGTPVGYFVDDPTAQRVDAQLELLTALSDAGVRELLLHATGLSPASLRAVTEVIRRLRQLEGLPNHPPAANRSSRARLQ